MKRHLLFTPIIVAALALSACDKADQERKKSLEKQADAKEDAAKVVKDVGDAKAHSDKEAAQRQADQLKKEADATRDAK